MDYFLFISSIALFSFSMCFTPGPNNAAAMAIGLSRGFKAAVPFCLGCCTCAMFTQFLTGLGLGEVFLRVPLLYNLLKVAGVLYILWLAWKISGLSLPAKLTRAFSRQKESGTEPAATGSSIATETEAKTENEYGEVSEEQAKILAKANPAVVKSGKPPSFFQGVGLQAVNIKVWMTNIIVVSQFVGSGEYAFSRLVAVSLFIPVIGTIANFTWAAGGVIMSRFLTSAGMRRANYIFALFLVLSVVLLLV
ncbi:LysE family translocator [Desulfovibrio sp. OttesenSCG-928-C06]|nr:LysE family translocator [Desulfovibrio sp. OttesenSCG-928-C06]